MERNGFICNISLKQLFLAAVSLLLFSGLLERIVFINHHLDDRLILKGYSIQLSSHSYRLYKMRLANQILEDVLLENQNKILYNKSTGLYYRLAAKGIYICFADLDLRILQ